MRRIDFTLGRRSALLAREDVVYANLASGEKGGRKHGAGADSLRFSIALSLVQNVPGHGALPRICDPVLANARSGVLRGLILPVNGFRAFGDDFHSEIRYTSEAGSNSGTMLTCVEYDVGLAELTRPQADRHGRKENLTSLATFGPVLEPARQATNNALVLRRRRFVDQQVSVGVLDVSVEFRNGKVGVL
jgi:hypothetical protein